MNRPATRNTPENPDLRPLDWQDIRLCAGEGKLSVESILDAANILWGEALRARDGAGRVAANRDRAAQSARLSVVLGP